jgi:NADP-dependent 3-hydroxy acid dehydrogenase YdfG
VALAARELDACERVCASIGASRGTAIPVAMDVGSSDSVESAVARAAKELGGLDILLNNAGVTQTVALVDQDGADWDRIVDTNLKGALMVGSGYSRDFERYSGGYYSAIEDDAREKGRGLWRACWTDTE